MKEVEEESAETVDNERKNKTVTLIVNSRPKQWDENHITFREVVALQYGQFEDNPAIAYTVGYSKGPKQNPQGTLVDNDRVKVQDRMNFNVSRTDKS